MSTTRACGLCGTTDSWRHALLNCPVARCTWVLSSDDILDQLSSQQQECPKMWLFAMMRALKPDDFIRFSVSLWAIWGARRKALYEGIFKSPQTTHGFINSYITGFQIIASNIEASGGGNVQHPVWIAPPGGYAKLDVDAAVGCRSRFGAVAAICRDWEGIFLGASAFIFKHVKDPATLEALAIRVGLDLAADLHIPRVHAATDCKGVASEIGRRSSAVFGVVIREIEMQASSFISCKVVYQSGTSNFDAHNLAKHALTLSVGRHVWLGQREGIPFVPVNIVTT